MKVCLILTCIVAVTRAEAPVSGYLPPSQGSNFVANARSQSFPSQSFGESQGLPSSYDASEERSKQSARNFHSAAFSPSFGAKPLSKFSTPSRTYLPAQQFSPNHEHGVHSLRSGLNHEHGVSNFQNQPHQEHGVPTQRHGRFEHGNFGDNGYESNAENGHPSSSEPANYGFNYAVNDGLHGTEFGHTESRHDEKAQGQYQVLLPDGRKQTVEYEADEAGFKPHISYEDAESQDASTRSGYGSGPAGYNDNAQNVAKNHHAKKHGKDVSSRGYH